MLISQSLPRRSFLKYLGAGAAGLVAGHLLGPLARAAESAAPSAVRGWTSPTGSPDWLPVPYPLPIGSDGGSAETDAQRYAAYTVRDELLLPEGFRHDLITCWGDRFGGIVVGHNADYTGIAAIAGTTDEFWLIVNHEYISARPWIEGLIAIGRSPLDGDGSLGGVKLVELDVDLLDPAAVAALADGQRSAIRRMCTQAMEDLGVSVLRVRRLADGRFEVMKDSGDHFRFTGIGAQNASADAMSFTGPAAEMLGRPRGTYGNCSGATTPWGTFLTCEENFQDQAPEFIMPAGTPLPGDRKRLRAADDETGHPLPFEFEGLGTGVEPPLDGRQYGWVCEVDPVKRTLRKHTSLGRFRHENVALRAEAGRKLAAYMGDDRRGGHVWKFVSDDVVTDPKDSANTQLLERGTLYVAQFDEDFTGRWIPLAPATPLVRPEPDHCVTGHLWLPRRPEGGHIAVGTHSAKNTQISPRRWIAEIERFTGKSYDQATLADLVTPSADQATQAAVLPMDAYAFANAVGGTPCSRPEDIEVHPFDRSIYIAFTDSTGSGDGSPDVRIFPDSRGDNSRQYGAIYRIEEENNDPAASRFRWGKFVSSGELADAGGSFACADNLVFDPQGNLWMVTDISTPLHNAAVSRSADDKTLPGEKAFVGVFGNNALFMIPTTGPNAGVPYCFAIGPTECEMTGPTFTDDGQTLILAIQHPGELHGTRGGSAAAPRPDTIERKMTLASRDGKTRFVQTRTVPLGSTFPTGKPHSPPLPCVVCITRAPRA